MRLDGRAIGPSALDTRLPVDPGQHRIEASAVGKRTWVGSVVVEAGPTEQVVRVPVLEDGPPARSTPPSSPPVAEGPSGRQIAGWTALGIGVVGVAVGAVFGARTFATEDDADEICPTRVCSSQEGLDLHEDASTFGLISTIAFGVGIGAAALGVGLLVIPTGESASSKSQTKSAPAASTRGAMLGWRGRW